jgi:hypothetical protein
MQFEAPKSLQLAGFYLVSEVLNDWIKNGTYALRFFSLWWSFRRSIETARILKSEFNPARHIDIAAARAGRTRKNEIWTLKHPATDSLLQTMGLH